MGQIKRGNVNVIVRKRQGQTIEFGVSKEIDKALRIRTQGQEVIQRQISPTIAREITVGQEQLITLGFINPKGKLRKVLLKPSTSKDKIKELDLLLKDSSKKGFKADVQKIKEQIKSLKERTAKVLQKKAVKEVEAVQISGLPSVQLPSRVLVQPTEEIIGRLPPIAPPRLPPSVISITPQRLTGLETLSIIALGAIQAPTPEAQFSLLEVGVQRTTQIQQQPTRLELQQPTQFDLQETTQIQQPRLETRIRTQPRLREELTQRERLRLQVRQLLSLEQVPVTRPRERLRQEEAARARPPPTFPRVRIPKILPVEPAREMLMEVAKGVKEEFEIFTRTMGEDVSIGKAATKEGAVKKLRKKLKGTIRASGFIEEGGERIPFRNLGIFNGEFRQSRIDAFRVVQIKEARLGTPSEVEEIQLFGKAKGGALFRNPKSRRLI